MWCLNVLMAVTSSYLLRTIPPYLHSRESQYTLVSHLSHPSLGLVVQSKSQEQRFELVGDPREGFTGKVMLKISAEAGVEVGC